MATRALRLRSALWERAKALRRTLERTEVRWALGGEVTEHDVLRMALERGLADLEKIHPGTPREP